MKSVFYLLIIKYYIMAQIADIPYIVMIFLIRGVLVDTYVSSKTVDLIVLIIARVDN